MKRRCKTPSGPWEWSATGAGNGASSPTASASSASPPGGTARRRGAMTSAGGPGPASGTAIAHHVQEDYGNLFLVRRHGLPGHHREYGFQGPWGWILRPEPRSFVLLRRTAMECNITLDEGIWKETQCIASKL